jgi:hypothetical protein
VASLGPKTHSSPETTSAAILRAGLGYATAAEGISDSHGLISGPAAGFVFAAVNPVRQLSSDVVIGGEHLLMPALLGELFATIARVPTFVLSERVERGICLAHSLRVLLIWHVRLNHLGRPPADEPFALQRCLEGHGVPPPLETEDTSARHGRFAECFLRIAQTQRARCRASVTYGGVATLTVCAPDFRIAKRRSTRIAAASGTASITP